MTELERSYAFRRAKKDFLDMADHSQYPIRVMETALEFEKNFASKELIMTYIKAAYQLI